MIAFRALPGVVILDTPYDQHIIPVSEGARLLRELLAAMTRAARPPATSLSELLENLQ